MSRSFRIESMSLADLEIAVEWAAQEGWNPGLDDAETFHAVDPEGFFMGWLDDKPVTAVSVVRHSDAFAFLGFYLCHPEHRGKGFGWQTWQAGMKYAGDRIVGLDGVPDQQSNYQKSGFSYLHQTQRFGGTVMGCAHTDHSAATDADLNDLLEFERQISAVERDLYLTRWFTASKHRRTLVCRINGQIKAVGTIRVCRDGHKIGPLLATSYEAALKMIEALVDAAGAVQVFIDVPDPNMAAAKLVRDLALTSTFSCARMYRGGIIERDMSRIFGEVAFELG